MSAANKVSQAQAEKALAIVAAWLGKKKGMTEDGSPTPTGKDAAYRALGPELVMAWDWPDKPTPTIILEGGPHDWAVEVSLTDEQIAEFAKVGIFAEPYAGYALCLYPDGA